MLQTLRPPHKTCEIRGYALNLHPGLLQCRVHNVIQVIQGGTLPEVTGFQEKHDLPGMSYLPRASNRSNSLARGHIADTTSPNAAALGSKIDAVHLRIR